jgi:N-acetylmuramoyl-L-alanine amidase
VLKLPYLAVLAAALAVIALPGPARAQDATPIDYTIRVIENERGVRLVIGFTRQPDYEVRAESDRVHVILHEPEVRPPFKRQRYQGEVLEKIRFAKGWDTSEIIFYTGRDFASHSTFEMREPFRLVLDLRRRGGTAPLQEDDEFAPPPAERIPDRGGAEPADTPGDMAPPPKRRAGFVVVIDPGHGGEEDGAAGPTGLLEKDVTLDIARRLKARLEDGSDVEVVLTRNDDATVALDDRTAIANHERADLFVSIHANASRRTGVRGAETYFLSHQATDDESRVVAAIENNAMGIDAGVQGQPGLEMVLWELAQSAFLKESSALAEMIQDNLNDALDIRNRGIKQAPFRVLMGATMPAVLVEVGFISNAEEEDKLRRPAFKEKLAEMLHESIRQYRTKYLRAEGR